jgi:hypothetical protein
LGVFDVITLWHCLEHAADPHTFLTAVASLAKPGGRIFVAVPNAVCPGMIAKREDWVWCQQPFVHTVHFTPNSLRELAENLGLRCLGLWSRDTWDANRRFDLAPHPWLWRIGRRLQSRQQLNFYFSEASRLFCYFIGCGRHWLLRRESSPETGSELCLLVQKP